MFIDVDRVLGGRGPCRPLPVCPRLQACRCRHARVLAAHVPFGLEFAPRNWAELITEWHAATVVGQWGRSIWEPVRKSSFASPSMFLYHDFDDPIAPQLALASRSIKTVFFSHELQVH